MSSKRPPVIQSHSSAKPAVSVSPVSSQVEFRLRLPQVKDMQRHIMSLPSTRNIDLAHMTPPLYLSREKEGDEEMIHDMPTSQPQATAVTSSGTNAFDPSIVAPYGSRRGTPISVTQTGA